jgi:hypothetical protein
MNRGPCTYPLPGGTLTSTMHSDPLETGITQLRKGEIIDLAVAQLGVRNLIAEPIDVPRVKDRVFSTNNELWRALIAERLRATATVELKDFWLSEWFPLRPGLFHSSGGEASRRAAQSWLLTGPEASRAMRTFREQYGREIPPAFVQHLESSSTRIYNPYGKALMLDGGVGCVRLKSKRLPIGEVWFMGATSEPVAHQGIPVALPDNLYRAFIDQLASSGSIRCSLTGELRHVPPDFDPLYWGLVDLPQVYVLVDRLIPSLVIPDAKFVADGAVMIEATTAYHRSGESRLADGIFAAYASFYPGLHGSISKAAKWLADAYAGELLGGTVLTDFDEQVRRFGNAIFSLECVMDGCVSAAGAGRLLGKSEIGQSRIQQFIERIEIVNADVRNTYVSDSDNVVVVVGDGNAVAGPSGAAATQGSTVTQSPIARERAPGRSRAKSTWARTCGAIALAATAIATVLVILKVTDIGIAGYVVAVVSAIATIIPILINKE